jgi:hypothetical protein
MEDANKNGSTMTTTECVNTIRNRVKVPLTPLELETEVTKFKKRIEAINKMDDIHIRNDLLQIQVSQIKRSANLKRVQVNNAIIQTKKKQKMMLRATSEYHLQRTLEDIAVDYRNKAKDELNNRNMDEDKN